MTARTTRGARLLLGALVLALLGLATPGAHAQAGGSAAAAAPTQVVLDQVVLTVSADSEAADVRAKERVAYPDGLKKALTVDSDAVLAISFQLKAKGDGAKTVKAAQTVVRFVSERQEELSLAATPTNGGYRLEVSTARDADAFLWRSGKYTAEVLVGDVDVAPLSWTIGSITLNFPSVVEAVKPSLFEPLPLFTHVFRPQDPRPSIFTSILFTGVVLAPWALLFLLWGRLKVNVANFPPQGAGLAAPVFHVSIAAMFGLLGWYWLSLNMFQLLGYLTVPALVAVFSGKVTLNAMAKQR